MKKLIALLLLIPLATAGPASLSVYPSESTTQLEANESAVYTFQVTLDGDQEYDLEFAYSFTSETKWPAQISLASGSGFFAAGQIEGDRTATALNVPTGDLTVQIRVTSPLDAQVQEYESLITMIARDGVEATNDNGIGWIETFDVTAVYDPDFDDDSVENGIDNCPNDANADQADVDNDGRGDACDNINDLDVDGDGFNNDVDNCPTIANPDQANSDGDAAGDACDSTNDLDVDGDGVNNDADNCRDVANADQADIDDDSVGDACDPTDDRSDDADEDGVNNLDDNCPTTANADQADLDGDDIGDACDDDRDGDGALNTVDVFPDDGTEIDDQDEDGIGDNADLDDDNDGATDEEEAIAGSDPHVVDSDGDGLTDGEEIEDGTNPTDRFSPDFRPKDAFAIPNTDRALIIWTPGFEGNVKDYYVFDNRSNLIGTLENGETSPDGNYRIFDGSYDGTPTRYYIQPRLVGDDSTILRLSQSTQTNGIQGLDLANACDDVDTDGDGICDTDEIELGTNPNDADSDNDGISDGDEVRGTNPSGAITSPLHTDTDGDLSEDRAEIEAGSNPLNPTESVEKEGGRYWVEAGATTVAILLAIAILGVVLFVRRQN